MNKEDAKNYVLIQKPTFLAKAKRKGYVCPICGNGTGDSGDGLVKSKDATHYKCYKCGMYGNIIDLIGYAKGIDNVRDKFLAAYEYYGVNVDNEKLYEPDLVSYFKKAARNNNFEYLLKRGISVDTQKHFMVGFDPKWIHPSLKDKPYRVPYSPRCIIPTGKRSYLARDTRNSIPQKQQKYAKSKVGEVQIFNGKALYENDVIFIVEGEIDAMSIYEAGETALALGSTSNIRILVDMCREVPRKTFILMLDDDKAGKKAEMLLCKGDLSKDITSLNDIGHYVMKGHFEGNDPNEALVKNRTKFCESVKSMANNARSASKTRRLKEIDAEIAALKREAESLRAKAS